MLCDLRFLPAPSAQPGRQILQFTHPTLTPLLPNPAAQTPEILSATLVQLSCYSGMRPAAMSNERDVERFAVARSPHAKTRAEESSADLAPSSRTFATRLERRSKLPGTRPNGAPVGSSRSCVSCWRNAAPQSRGDAPRRRAYSTSSAWRRVSGPTVRRRTFDRPNARLSGSRSSASLKRLEGGLTRPGSASGNGRAPTSAAGWNKWAYPWTGSFGRVRQLRCPS